MKVTGERLEALRERNGWSKTYVAKRLGLKNMSTYANWEYGEREPDNETLVRLAELHEVTTDYLLGRSNDPRLTYQQELQVDKRTKELMDVFNKLGETDQAFFKQTMENFIKAHKKEQ